jgi:hypothetical protein
LNRALFSSARHDWTTPGDVYRSLNEEFSFTLDPCNKSVIWDGCIISWSGERVFCNPPYKKIEPWLEKAREASLAVYLLPSRTDTRWWHNYALKADEIRFIRGRLKFGEAINSAPFPSVILVYKGGINDSKKEAANTGAEATDKEARVGRRSKAEEETQ